MAQAGRCAAPADPTCRIVLTVTNRMRGQPDRLPSRPDRRRCAVEDSHGPVPTAQSRELLCDGGKLPGTSRASDVPVHGAAAADALRTGGPLPSDERGAAPIRPAPETRGTAPAGMSAAPFDHSLTGHQGISMSINEPNSPLHERSNPHPPPTPQSWSGHDFQQYPGRCGQREPVRAPKIIRQPVRQSRAACPQAGRRGEDTGHRRPSRCLTEPVPLLAELAARGPSMCRLEHRRTAA
jgi:hypothetical protein